MCATWRSATWLPWMRLTSFSAPSSSLWLRTSSSSCLKRGKSWCTRPRSRWPSWTSRTDLWPRRMRSIWWMHLQLRVWCTVAHLLKRGRRFTASTPYLPSCRLIRQSFSATPWRAWSCLPRKLQSLASHASSSIRACTSLTGIVFSMTSGTEVASVWSLQTFLPEGLTSRAWTWWSISISPRTPRPTCTALAELAASLTQAWASALRRKMTATFWTASRSWEHLFPTPWMLSRMLRLCRSSRPGFSGRQLWKHIVIRFCVLASQAEWLVSSSQAGWNPKTWVSVRCCLSWGVGSIVVPVKYDVSWGVGSEGIPAYKQVEILGPEVLRALVRQHLPQVVLKDPEDVSADVQASYAGQAASEAAKVAGLAPATEAPAALSMKWQEISLKLWRFWSKWRWIGNSCLCWRGRTGSGWGGVHVMFFVSSLEHMPKTRKTDILDAERWYLMHPDASRCKLQFEFVQANAAGVAAVKDALQDAGVASDQVGVWLRCRMGFIMIVSSIKITQWQAYECMWERL